MLTELNENFRKMFKFLKKKKTKSKAVTEPAPASDITVDFFSRPITPSQYSTLPKRFGSHTNGYACYSSLPRTGSLTYSTAGNIYFCFIVCFVFFKK